MSLLRFVQAAAVALCLPGAALACVTLSQNFDLCDEGSPWAGGTWEQFGDGATLHLDGFKYDGFEDYAFRDDARAGGPELDALMSDDEGAQVVTHHLRDEMQVNGLTIARSIDIVSLSSGPDEMRVTMIAEGKSEKILLMVRGPADATVARAEVLSRGYAGLVQPAKEGE